MRWECLLPPREFAAEEARIEVLYRKAVIGSDVQEYGWLLVSHLYEPFFIMEQIPKSTFHAAWLLKAILLMLQEANGTIYPRRWELKVCPPVLHPPRHINVDLVL